MTSFLARPTFDVLEVHAHEVIDGEIAELWTHIPMRVRPNFPAEPDPAKPPYRLAVKFAWESKLDKMGFEESSIVSRAPRLEIRTPLIRYAINSGDQFQRCKTNELFEVTVREPDTYSGVSVHLVQIGRPE